jgi:hypothetical protein
MHQKQEQHCPKQKEKKAKMLENKNKCGMKQKNES